MKAMKLSSFYFSDLHIKISGFEKRRFCNKENRKKEQEDDLSRPLRRSMQPEEPEAKAKERKIDFGPVNVKAGPNPSTAWGAERSCPADLPQHIGSVRSYDTGS